MCDRGGSSTITGEVCEWDRTVSALVPVAGINSVGSLLDGGERRVGWLGKPQGC